MENSQIRVQRWTLPILALALAIVFLFVIPAVEANALEISQAQEKTLVVLGDSIANGSSAPAVQGYGPRVARDQSMTLINRAVGGWRTDHVINQLKTDVVTQEAVKAADVIQITIGGNDLQQSGYVGPAIDAILLGDPSVWEQHCKNIAGRFAQIVDLVRELNPDAPFFVFNSYTPDYKRYGNTNIRSTLGTTMDITGNQLYAIAQDYAIPYFNTTYTTYLEQNPYAFILVDIFDAFPDNDSSYYGLLIDIIHPSALGHEKLAGRLNTAIDAYNAERLGARPIVKIANAVTTPGNAAEVTYSIEGNVRGFSVMDLNIPYDGSIYEPISVTAAGSLATTFFVANSAYATNIMKVAFISKEDIVDDNLLFTVTYQVAATAPNVGEYPLNVEVLKMQCDSKTGNLVEFKVDVKPGILVLGIPGDINGDGKITPEDAMELLQMYVGLIPWTERALLLGDINKDGIIDPTDAALILRMVVG
ncbi:MAG: GDSL-type esterase/lipase family protein [Clostridiales bacterium]|nr:GDSL-type esterase/lipase family protein [Clostridiales bacterium]